MMPSFPIVHRVMKHVQHGRLSQRYLQLRISIRSTDLMFSLSSAESNFFVFRRLSSKRSLDVLQFFLEVSLNLCVSNIPVCNLFGVMKFTLQCVKRLIKCKADKHERKKSERVWSKERQNEKTHGYIINWEK